MRIAHLLNHTRKANGHVEVTVDLACEQARQGHDVTVVSGTGDFADCLAANGVAFRQIADRTGPMRPALMAFDVAAVLRHLNPEIVHAHMVMSAIAARAAQPFADYALITSVHNSFDRQSRMMGLGNMVIAVSEAVRREMAQKGIPASRLRTVLNGTIGGSRRPPMPRETMTLRRPAIATVAGLHPRKGIDTLIAAFAKFRNAGSTANLYIVGSGPDQEKLERQASSTGYAPDIHFLGHMNDPRTALAGADVFVLASLQEPCGLALIEARQMGCACIGSNVGGIPEVLENGKAGLLFAPGNCDQLAGAFRALINNEALLRKMRRSAHSRLQYWTVERMAKQTISVYDEALERRAIRRDAARQLQQA